MTPAAKHTLRVAGAVVVIAAMILFARSVNWGQTWHAIRSAEVWPLFVAGVVNMVSLALKGSRWWIFLRAIGSPPLGLAVRSTIVGSGVDNLLVANSGDASRVVVLSVRSGLPKSTVFATLVLERLFDVLAFAMLLLGSLIFLPINPDLARFRWLAVVLLVVILALLALLMRHAPEAGAEKRYLRKSAHPSVVARVRNSVSRFFHASAALASIERFAAAAALSLLVWIGQLATYHLVARSAHFPITLAGSVAALLAVNVGLVIRATPGNVGLFQLVYAAAATTLGLDKDAAVAVAFLIQSLQILPVTLIALVFAPGVLLHRKEVAEEIAHIAEPESALHRPSVADRRRRPREES